MPLSITTQQLQTIMGALGHDLPSLHAEQYTPLLIEACEEWGINTNLRLAALLGIIGYESGGLTTWSEVGGTTQSYAPYYGRGPIQLTWEGNYREFGTAYNTPEKFVDNPDLIATPEWGFRAACWFWRNANGDLNTFADAGDFWDCYLRVAGADNGTFSQRKQIYDKALAVLGQGGTTMVTAEDLIATGRALQGASYDQWDGYWPPSAGAPFWMYGEVSVDLVLKYGCNCSGFINAIRRINGLDALGGTGSIGDRLINLLDFDVTAPAIPGAIALRPWTGGVADVNEGHVALYTSAHDLLQADHRGVNEDDSDYDSQSWAQFTVYGLMDDIDYSGEEQEGGSNGSGQHESWQWIAIDGSGWLRVDGPDWSGGWWDSGWAFHRS